MKYDVRCIDSEVCDAYRASLKCILIPVLFISPKTDSVLSVCVFQLSSFSRCFSIGNHQSLGVKNGIEE